MLASAQSTAKPLLIRCEMDGTMCTKQDLSAGQGQSSGVGARGTVDPVAKKLLLVAPNNAKFRA